MRLPLRYSVVLPASVSGATPEELAPFGVYDPIRQIERASIREFMERSRQYLRGRVLDFGCGTQPYKHLVDGEYVPHDPPLGITAIHGLGFDAVMCNQMIQYVPDFADVLCHLRDGLKPGGHLVMTYPTNWDEVEVDDLWRFTRAGMEHLLAAAGFILVAHERRAEVAIGNFKFPLGYGLIARK